MGVKNFFSVVFEDGPVASTYLLVHRVGHITCVEVVKALCLFDIQRFGIVEAHSMIKGLARRSDHCAYVFIYIGLIPGGHRP